MADTPKLVTEEDLALVVSNISQKVNESNKTIILSGKNDSETTTSSGVSSISCGNSAGGANIVGLYAEGKSEQYVSKNLLNSKGLAPYTNRGVTFTPVFKDGLLQYVNVKWDTPPSGNTYYKIEEFATKGTFIVSGGASHEVAMSCWRNDSESSATDEGRGATLTVGDDKEFVYIRVLQGAGVSASNVNVYPMIRLASETDSTYEPYTGTPTPTNPIAIKDASGVVEARTDNLFDGIIEQGGLDNGLNAPNPARVRSKNYISVHPSTIYTIVNENNLVVAISYYSVSDFATPRIGSMGWTSGREVTFTTPSECKYLRFIYKKADESNILPSECNKVGIQIGFDAEYVEYKSNGIELNSLIWEQGTIAGSTGEETARTDRIRTNYVADNVIVKFVDANNSVGFYFYDANKNFISANYWLTPQYHGTEIKSKKYKPSNAKYVRTVIKHNDESVIAPSYISKTTVYAEKENPINIDLRSIGNIADTITVNEDGSAEWVQKVGVSLTSELTWGEGSTFWESTSLSNVVKRPSSASELPNVLCETLSKRMASGISTVGKGTNYIAIGTSGGSVYSTSTDNPKNWSNVHIYYELATPIVHTLTKEQVDAILALRMYQDTTIIESELNLKEVKYLKQCEVVDALKIIKGWFDSAKVDPMTTADADALYTEVFGN